MSVDEVAPEFFILGRGTGCVPVQGTGKVINLEYINLIHFQ